MKIVILDKSAMGHDTPFSVLDDLGEVISYDQSSPEQVKERCSDADVIVLNKVKITREIMVSAKSLRLVCVFATGFDNIDLLAAKELGIAVCNVPGYSTESVALFTLSTVLSLITHMSEYSEYVRSGEYTASSSPNKLTPIYHDLCGKTWGIIGYGNIGRAVGKVAETLGARVIVNKRVPCEDAACVDIDTICRESDIITVHCPLNDSTMGLINSERLAMMRPDVVLVNEARGAVLDEEAVAKAVHEGKIGAFGCDVYSVEPFGTDHPYYAIRERKNVLLTPHAAWASYEARAKCIGIIAENIRSFSEGKMKNRVDI